MSTIFDTAKRFKDFRKQEGITQVMLSKELDLSQSVISRYDRGEVDIPMVLIRHLHERYKMSYEWFFHGTRQA
jgi:transcriptional regulator with XRE-family HTH domain